MVGQITYTEDQILFVLRLALAKERGPIIMQKYQEHFNKTLTSSQLRYIKTKYGHDPEFGTALINGTLPETGGNRKTAVPSHKDNREEIYSNISHVSFSGALVTKEPNQDLTRPDVQLEPSPSSFAQDLQQGCWSQEQSQPAFHNTPSNLTYAMPSNESELSNTPTSPDEPIKITFDPDNPYGYQPVLEYYRSTGYGVKSAKRQSEEDATQHRSTAAQQNDVKRLKIQSSRASSRPQSPQQFLPSVIPNLVTISQVTQSGTAAHHSQPPQQLPPSVTATPTRTTQAIQPDTAVTQPQFPQHVPTSVNTNPTKTTQIDQPDTAGDQPSLPGNHAPGWTFTLPPDDPLSMHWSSMTPANSRQPVRSTPQEPTLSDVSSGVAQAQSFSGMLDPNSLYPEANQSPSPGFNDLDPNLWASIFSHTSPPTAMPDNVIGLNLESYPDMAPLNAWNIGIDRQNVPSGQQWSTSALESVAATALGQDQAIAAGVIDDYVNIDWQQVLTLGNQEIREEYQSQLYPFLG